MESAVIEQRLRKALLLVVIALCLGTMVELWLANHTESTIQLLPFGWCAIGGVAAASGLVWPRRGTVLALRAVMVLLAFGSLIGVYEHWSANLAFALEIRPAATFGDVWLEALKGGSPLLAPGILALAATLGWLATYAHPLLAPFSAEQAARSHGDHSRM